MIRGIVDTTPLVEAALAWLQADAATGLRARIDEVNGLYTDRPGWGVPYPEQFTDGTEDLTRPTAVEVASSDFDLYSGSVAQVDWALDISIIVHAILEDARAGMAHRRAQILASAIVDSLCQPSAFGNGVGVLRVRGSFPVNPETGDTTRWIGNAILAFTLDADGQRSTP